MAVLSLVAALTSSLWAIGCGGSAGTFHVDGGDDGSLGGRTMDSGVGDGFDGSVLQLDGLASDGPLLERGAGIEASCAGPLLPIFRPASQTASNDFLVSFDVCPATDGCSGTNLCTPPTICFTTDGTTPACDAPTGRCLGSSQTYNPNAGVGASGSVTINGAVTDPATGKVAIKAMACGIGIFPSPVASQTFTLQVATPVMQGPAPGTLPFDKAGYFPNMSSSTNGASLRWTSNGLTPDCNTGTLLAGNPGALPVPNNVNYEGVACKPGYAPSAPATFTYTVTLAPPAFVDSTSNAIAEGTGTYDRTFSIGFDPTPDTYTGGPVASGLYMCYSTTTLPVCGMAPNACLTGTFANHNLNAVGMASVPITTTGTTINVVACSRAFNSSGVASATYTLQLDAPGLYGAGGPGCDPVVAGAPTHCYATTAAWIIPSFLFLPGTYDPAIEEWYGTPPPSAVTRPQYAFACVAKGMVPACAAAGCTVGVAVAGADFQSPAAPTFGSAGLGPIAYDDSWTIVGCPGTVSPGFIASKPTNFYFSHPDNGPAPAITPVGATFNNQLTATVQNEDPTVTSYVCTTTGTTAAPPTDPVCDTSGGASCEAGTVHSLGLKPFGSSAMTGYVLTSGGTGYTSTPTVTIAPPPAGTQAIFTATVGFSVGSYTVQSGGAGCPANPTVNIAGGAQPFGGVTADAAAIVTAASNVVSAVMIKTTGGSGYTTPPTVSVLGCGTAPVVVANLAPTGSVVGLSSVNAGSGYGLLPLVTVSGGGGSGATATGVLDSAFTLGPFQVDATTVKARACRGRFGAWSQSPVVSQTYNFKVGMATVGDWGNLGTPPASLNGAPPGINLTTGSNFRIGNILWFQVPPQTPAAFSGPAPSMCITFDGSTPTCACTPRTYVRNSTLTGPPGWFAGADPANATQRTAATTFAPGTSTMNVIACDVNAQPSDVMTVTLNLQ